MAARIFTPTNLMMAIRAGLLDGVINAITMGADIEEADMHGFTGLPLRTACFEGNVAIVRELLNHGADINAIAGDGPNAPLRLAQRGKHQDIIALLLAHGAETTPAATQTPLPRANIEAPTDTHIKFEETPSALPDNSIEFTRDEPNATGDIEEINLTAGYGLDTNLLTLDLLRMSEEDAAVLRSDAASTEAPAKNEKPGVWTRRG